MNCDTTNKNVCVRKQICCSYPRRKMDPPSHSDNISSLLVVNHTMNETEDQLIETTSKDLCQTPDLASTRMQISDLLSTPPERLDHRMEKEMGESPDLPSLPYSSGMNPREKSKVGSSFGPACELGEKRNMSLRDCSCFSVNILSISCSALDPVDGYVFILLMVILLTLAPLHTVPP